jgi:CHAT domain-containing protein
MGVITVLRRLYRLSSVVKFLLIVCLTVSISLIPGIAVGKLTPTDHAALISQLESQLKIAQAQFDRSQEARIRSDLGSAYKNIGQYTPAIELQQQAGQIFRDLKDWRSLGQVLINLGNAQAAIGDYETAKLAYEKSLAIAKRNRDAVAQADALSSLGNIAASYGRDQAALQSYNAALQIQTQLQQTEAAAYTLLNLGSIHHVLQQFDLAIDYTNQARRIAQTANNQSLEATTLTNLGSIYEYQKDYTKAVDYHRQAVAIAQKLNQPQVLAQTLNNYGYTMLQMGDLVNAEKTVGQSIQILENVRSQLQEDRYKISLFDTRLFSYRLLQQIRIAANQPEEALVVAEQGRSRAFAELLAKNQNQSAQTITLDQIRHIAKTQKATLVEYSLISDRRFRVRGKQQGKAESLMIWVVQPNGKITFRQVDLRSRWETQGEIKQIVRASRCLQPIPACPALKTDNPPAISPIASLNYPGLPELHEILINPIADLLPTNRHDPVIFIPQDSLFLVPFAALPNAQGEYLIQRHTIATAPSIQVLNLTRRGAQKPWQADQILVAGNPSPMPINLAPLPHAETEATNISQRFQAQPLLGQSLTRSQLLSRLDQAKLIHLATHGLLEYGQQNALDIPGAIALAQTPQDSGILTATEITKLKLKADLVVLSACDTGRGTISGDGVLGLARSWMTAGASNVVVSLWAVSDESTAYLMEQFYSALANQPNYAIALRQAMLKTMEKYPSPYDWSAFMLMGA